MSFISFNFLLFFPFVVLIYHIIPCKLRNLWLLLASYFFYMCWNARYALVILFSTIVTYLSGLLISKLPHKKGKQFVVAISVVLNLGVLFFFKYYDFALGIVQKCLSLAHISLNIPVFDVLLPVGISFFTFQALSYTFDVYNGDTYAEKNFLEYALFVSFFPQLVAGPIERSKHLLKQLATPRKLTWDSFKDGLLLMLWGYFLKMVIADRISEYVTIVYGGYYDFGGWYIVVATVLFAFQIYCDFYGYSTIAMGAAQILGIQLMENFDAPYLATSVADFWRRWHISLTSWFRDYLYIPLGGNRKGKFRQYLNIMIVFLVSGLWHGAKFSFVAWGGLNGLYQVIGDMFRPIRQKIANLFHMDLKLPIFRIGQILLTFVLVDFSWIFFRANSFSEAFVIIRQMITAHNVHVLFDGSVANGIISWKNFILLMLSLLVLLVADVCKSRGIKIRPKILQSNSLIQILVFSFSVVFILLFGKYGTGYDAAQFIYFQF